MLDIPDDPRTLWVRKKYLLKKYLLDATTKRHYNYGTIYEWDERKRVSNLEKHGLDFYRAKRVYEADRKITIETTKEGSRERRFLDIAEVESACVALVYTYRGESVRIISMRHARRKERRDFDASFKNR
ncbi:MAG: BrnT family toxin [Bacteroidota bacterium]